MNPSSPHVKTTAPREQDRRQLPLALENPQASECIPAAIRSKCLPLWRELLLSIVAKGNSKNGGGHD
jgi:hypothetical protein